MNPHPDDAATIAWAEHLDRLDAFVASVGDGSLPDEAVVQALFVPPAGLGPLPVPLAPRARRTRDALRDAEERGLAAAEALAVEAAARPRHRRWSPTPRPNFVDRRA